MPQKLLLALLVASRKLRHYFQGHPIKVISAYPLERVLRSPNAAGRVTQWNTELQAYQLEFSTTGAIKGAALADFVAEWTAIPGLEADEDRSLSLGSEAPDGWVMYFDGAFARQGAGAGAVLISPTQDKLYYAVHLSFQQGEKVCNNITENEGLIAGLKAAVALGVKRLTIRGDSYPEGRAHGGLPRGGAQDGKAVLGPGAATRAPGHQHRRHRQESIQAATVGARRL